MRHPSAILLASLLGLLALPLLTLGQAAQQPAPDAYAGEMKQLRQEYEKAQQTYYAPLYNVKTDEERRKIRLDPAKEPGAVYFPKFQALAKKADGTRTGAQATLMLTNLNAPGGTVELTREAYRTLLTKYASTMEAEQAAATMRYAGWTIGQEETRKLLRDVIDGNGPHDLRAAAMFALGANLLDDRGAKPEQKQEARDFFARLKKECADTQYANLADRAVFELENLQIGMTAPDFEATDQTGSKFKLSDYRGKVVVLDFWGFW